MPEHGSRSITKKKKNLVSASVKKARSYIVKTLKKF